jgi:hypothetical protein
MCSNLIALKQLGKGEMPDGLALPSNDIDFVFEAETLLLGELNDGIAGEFSQLVVVSRNSLG